MKKAICSVIFLPFLLASCKYTRIGDLTIVSTRNIDMKADYVELRRYVTVKVKIKDNQAMEQAIDEAVREVPGGEFMKNAKVYVRGSKKIKVEGDVWGVAGQNLTDKQQEKLEKKKSKAEYKKQKEALQND